MRNVSVCMVTYNQESYIEDAIKGVLMQKECDFEIVIADDHSTDRTFEICQKYQLECPDIITLIRQPENKGVVMNTRDCLLACSGKYIAICEGDDYWIDEYKLKKQVEILEKDNGISMVHTNWIDYHQDDGTFERNKRVSTFFYKSENCCGTECVIEIMKDLYRGIRFSSICFRNTVLRAAFEKDKELFSPRYSTCDLVLFYLLAYYGKFSYIPDETTIYRRLNESVSITRDRKKQTYYTLGVLNIKAHYIKDYHLPVSELNESLRASFYLPFDYAFRTKDKKLAIEAMESAKSINYKPTLGQRLKYLMTVILNT